MLKDEALECEDVTELFNLNKENTRPVLLTVASSRSRSFALVELTTIRNRPTTNAAAPILKKKWKTTSANTEHYEYLTKKNITIIN